MGENDGATADERAEARASFIRWQGVVRDQLSSVSNLVLGLATGLLAFLAHSSGDLKTYSSCELVLSVVTLLLLAASIVLAVACALNRLRDFRKTAQIARKRSKGEPIPTVSRLEVNVVGHISWCLFWWQLWLFAIGAVAVSFAMIFSIISLASNR